MRCWPAGPFGGSSTPWWAGSGTLFRPRLAAARHSLGSADVAFALTLLGAAWYYLRGLGRYLINDDEGSYLYAAWRISLGEWPYTDFLTPQLPGFLLPGGVLMRVLGPDVVAARAVAVVAALGAAFVLWWLTRRLLGPGPAFVAGALLLLSPDVFLELRTFRPDAFMLFVSCVGLAAFARATIPRPGLQDSPSRFWLVAAGACFGAGALIKLFAPFVLAGCLLWLAHDARRRGRNLVRLAGDTVAVVGSAAAVTLAGLGAFAVTGAPVFESVLGHHLAQGAGLPWISVLEKGLAFFVEYIRHHALLMFLAISAAAVAWRDGRREAALFAWQIPTVALFLVLSRDLYPRHLIYLLPAAAALAGWVVAELWKGAERFSRPAAVAVSLAFALPWALLNRDFAWRAEDGTQRVSDIGALLTAPDSLLLSDYSELNFYALRPTTYSGASLSAGAGQSGQITWARMADELETSGTLPGMVLVDRTTVEGESYGHLRFLRDVEDFEAWLGEHYEEMGVVWRRRRLPDRQEHTVYWPRGDTQPLVTDFGDLRMLAAGWPRHSGVLTAGDVLPVSSVWRAEEPLEEDVAVTARLVDGMGREWAQLDGGLLAAEGVPTSRWAAGEMTAQRLNLRLPAGVPPGEYDVLVGAYGRTTGELWVPETGANPAVVGRVRVLPWQPGRGAGRAASNATVGGLMDPGSGATNVAGLEMLGHSRLPFAPVTGGDSMEIDVWWRVVAPVEARSVRYTLGDRVSGTVAADVTLPLGAQGAADGAEAAWPVGTVVRQPVVVSVLVSSPGGVFSLAASEPSAAVAGDPIMMGDVTVVQRDLSGVNTTVPEVDANVNAVLGGFAELVGWRGPQAAEQGLDQGTREGPGEGPAQGPDAAPEGALVRAEPGQPVTITLVWRAAAAAPGRYKVSLQVVDAAGVPVAQHDSEPADWQRPTTSWVPGEVLEDAHTLNLPPNVPGGSYRLVVTMYDAVTGTRLAVTGDAGGGDQLEIGTLVVAP